MKISEMIKALTAILETEGDLRCTVYDDYTANEGWGFKNEDLWDDAVAHVRWVVDDDNNKIEKVVQF